MAKNSTPAPAAGARIRAHVEAREPERRASQARSVARSSRFSRVCTWMLWLPITRRQVILLGRIYSFQCTNEPMEFRMSLASIATELNYDKRHVKSDLDALVDLKLLLKRPTGPRRPCVYEVDERACVEAAVEAGWRSAAP